MPVIATNISSLSGIGYVNRNSSAQSKSLAKIASGSRIVRASDDAAGLAVSTRLKSNISTLKQAASNAMQAISVLQIADGAMAKTQSILMRMQTIAAQSNSGSIDNTQRSTMLNLEYREMVREIGSLLDNTTFNQQNLLDGGYAQNFQVGVNASNVILVDLISIDLGNLDNPSTNVSTMSGAANAVSLLRGDMNVIAEGRALIGAYLSRMQSRSDIINTSIENLASANSSIADVDIAAEQTRLASLSVLTEASIAALAQSNRMTSNLLTLLK